MSSRKAILFTIVLVVSATAFAQDDPQNSIATLEPVVQAGNATRAQQLDLARAYMGAGRYYEAGQIAGRLLALDAEDADALTIRDHSKAQLRAMGAQRIADAEAAARRSDATDADRVELANAYFFGSEYHKAADAYAKLPEDVMTPELRHNHARALAWSGQNDAAERAYAKLVAANPTPELELEYGRVLSWMGATDAAKKRLASAYQASRSEEAATALANVHAWSGDRAGAIAILDEFTAGNANAPEARALLEKIRTSPDLKIEKLDRAIEKEPYNLALRAERARLLYEAGRHGEALREIRFVREHPPASGSETVTMTSSASEDLLALEREILNHRRQQIAELDERLRNMNIHDPAIDDDVLAMARAYTSLAAYPQAIRLYAAYLDYTPNDRDARIAYARVLSWDRRYDAAQAQYDRLLREDPERADLRLEYAQAMSYDSEFVPAVREFRALTDLSTHPRGYLYSRVPVQAHYNLGQIYRWYGWRDEAANHQNRALELDTTFLPARDELFLARQGRPSSMFDARYTYATNSNDFTLQRVDLTGEHWLNQRLAVEAGVGRHNFEHRGTDVAANAASVGAMYRQTDRLMFRGRVGGTFYEEGLGTRPFWALGASYLPNIQSRAALDYNHYDLVYDVFTLQSLTPGGGVGDLGDPIAIDDFRGHYDWDSGGLWSFLGDVSYGFISDDNRRAGAHGLLAFRLWNKPFIAVKADGRLLSYDFRSNRYWSPEEYRSLAAVLQIGQNVRDRLYWNVEGKAGKSWEGSRNSDLRAIAATVTVPLNDLLDVVGHYSYGKSGRFESILGDSAEFVNYWQRAWYVGVRVKRLYAGDDRRGRNPYYFDNRPLTDSAVIPPEVR